MMLELYNDTGSTYISVPDEILLIEDLRENKFKEFTHFKFMKRNAGSMYLAIIEIDGVKADGYLDFRTISNMKYIAATYEESLRYIKMKAFT
jgi:hypothetical protein